MSELYNPENAVLDPEEQWFEDHFEEYVPENCCIAESIRPPLRRPPIAAAPREVVRRSLCLVPPFSLNFWQKLIEFVYYGYPPLVRQQYTFCVFPLHRPGFLHPR